MDTDITVSLMLKELRKLPLGSITSTGKLAVKTPGVFTDRDFRIIDKKFRKAAWKDGFYLDDLIYWQLSSEPRFLIDFAVQKRKPKKRFDHVRMHIHNLPEIPYELDINIPQKIVTFIEFIPEKQHQIHRCDDAEWAEIGYIIEDCNFSQWNNEYLASSEGDGCRVWEMKLQNNNKTVKKSYGHQKYPNSWMTFEALEAQCLLLFGIEKDYPV